MIDRGRSDPDASRPRSPPRRGRGRRSSRRPASTSRRTSPSRRWRRLIASEQPDLVLLGHTIDCARLRPGGRGGAGTGLRQRRHGRLGGTAAGCRRAAPTATSWPPSSSSPARLHAADAPAGRVRAGRRRGAADAHASTCSRPGRRRSRPSTRVRGGRGGRRRHHQGGVPALDRARHRGQGRASLSFEELAERTRGDAERVAPPGRRRLDAAARARWASRARRSSPRSIWRWGSPAPSSTWRACDGRHDHRGQHRPRGADLRRRPLRRGRRPVRRRRRARAGSSDLGRLGMPVLLRRGDEDRATGSSGALRHARSKVPLVRARARLGRCVFFYGVCAADGQRTAAGTAGLACRPRRELLAALRDGRAAAVLAPDDRAPGPYAGWAHRGIFYGFIVLFAGTVILGDQHRLHRAGVRLAATSTATSTRSTRNVLNVLGTALIVGRAGDDGPPRSLRPGQAGLRPARPRPRRSAVRPARCIGSATGSSSVSLLVIAITGYRAGGRADRDGSPGYNGTVRSAGSCAQLLDRRAERTDAGGISAT